jgi:hypothetical protein
MSKFELGQIVATPGALDTFSREELAKCLKRHSEGDWGDLDNEDKAANDDSLNPNHPGRLLSSYRLPSGKLYIITEWNRGVTTLLLPEEY